MLPAVGASSASAGRRRRGRSTSPRAASKRRTKQSQGFLPSATKGGGGKAMQRGRGQTRKESATRPAEDTLGRLTTAPSGAQRGSPRPVLPAAARPRGATSHGSRSRSKPKQRGSSRRQEGVNLPAAGKGAGDKEESPMPIRTRKLYTQPSVELEEEEMDKMFVKKKLPPHIMQGGFNKTAPVNNQSTPPRPVGHKRAKSRPASLRARRLKPAAVAGVGAPPSRVPADHEIMTYDEQIQKQQQHHGSGGKGGYPRGRGAAPALAVSPYMMPVSNKTSIAGISREIKRNGSKSRYDPIPSSYKVHEVKDKRGRTKSRKVYYFYGAPPPRVKKKPKKEDLMTRVERAQKYQAAATDVQKAFRGSRARKRVKGLREEKRRNDAATSIQRIARGRDARKAVAELRAGRADPRIARREKAAATKIQAAQRGKMGRKKAARVAKERAEQRAAATKIQAGFRGARAREELAQKHESATKIQSVARGRGGRRRVKQRHDAARKVQSVARGRQGRKEAAKRRAAKKKREEDEAAAAIQAKMRDMMEKKAATQRRKQNAAAARIQAIKRGKDSRQTVHNLRMKRKAVETFIRGVQRRNGIGTTVFAMAAALRATLGYPEDTAQQIAEQLHVAQVALMANVTPEDMATFLSRVVTPGKVLVGLAGCICVLFGQQPAWSNAMQILMAPDFYDVAMAMTPDMLEKQQRTTVRALINQHNLVRAAIQTRNEIIYLLARWVSALVGALGTDRPRSTTPPPADAEEDEPRKAAANSGQEGEAGVGEGEVDADAPIVDIRRLQAARLTVSSMPLDRFAEISTTSKIDKSLASVVAMICVLCNRKPNWANAQVFFREADVREQIVSREPTALTKRDLSICRNLDTKCKITEISTTDERRWVRSLALWAVAMARVGRELQAGGVMPPTDGSEDAQGNPLETNEESKGSEGSPRADSAAAAKAAAGAFSSPRRANTSGGNNLVAVAAAKLSAAIESSRESTAKSASVSALGYARHMVAVSTNEKEIRSLTSQHEPPQAAALVGAMICVLHKRMPPTWGATCKLINEHEFVPNTVQLRPVDCSEDSLKVVKQLFRMHNAWRLAQSEGGMVHALARWAGVMSGDRDASEDAAEGAKLRSKQGDKALPSPVKAARQAPEVVKKRAEATQQAVQLARANTMQRREKERAMRMAAVERERAALDALKARIEEKRLHAQKQAAKAEEAAKLAAAKEAGGEAQAAAEAEAVQAAEDRAAVVQAVAVAKLRGGKGGAGQGASEDEAQEARMAQLLAYALRRLAKAATSESLHTVRSVASPTRPVALMSGVMCVCHNLWPPTWSNAQSLMAQADFVQRCENIAPSSLNIQSAKVITELFRMHNTWDVVQTADVEEVVVEITRWGGLLVRTADVVKDTAALMEGDGEDEEAESRATARVQAAAAGLSHSPIAEAEDEDEEDDEVTPSPSLEAEAEAEEGEAAASESSGGQSAADGEASPAQEQGDEGEEEVKGGDDEDAERKQEVAAEAVRNMQMRSSEGQGEVVQAAAVAALTSSAAPASPTVAEGGLPANATVLQYAAEVLARASTEQGVREFVMKKTVTKGEALMCGMLCLAHGALPPSHSTAKKVVMGPNFLTNVKLLRPEHLNPNARKIITNLFRVHHTWSEVRNDTPFVLAATRWCGVLAGIDVVVKDTRRLQAAEKAQASADEAAAETTAQEAGQE